MMDTGKALPKNNSFFILKKLKAKTFFYFLFSTKKFNDKIIIDICF